MWYAPLPLHPPCHSLLSLHSQHYSCRSTHTHTHHTSQLHTFGLHGWYTSAWFTRTAIGVVVLWPLSLLPTMKPLRFTSMMYSNNGPSCQARTHTPLHHRSLTCIGIFVLVLVVETVYKIGTRVPRVCMHNHGISSHSPPPRVPTSITATCSADTCRRRHASIRASLWPKLPQLRRSCCLLLRWASEPAHPLPPAAPQAALALARLCDHGHGSTGVCLRQHGDERRDCTAGGSRDGADATPGTWRVTGHACD